MCACLPPSHSGFLGRPALQCIRSAYWSENDLSNKVMAHCLYLCVCRSSDSDMNGKTGIREPANNVVEANSNANNLSMAAHLTTEAQNHSQVSIVQYIAKKRKKTGETKIQKMNVEICLE